MTPPPSRTAGPLPCGADLAALVGQVADRFEPTEEARRHQAGCPHCQAALTDLLELWSLLGQVAAERVEAPAGVHDAVVRRVQRAMFLAEVASLFGGLLPRLGKALLVYGGLLPRAGA